MDAMDAVAEEQGFIDLAYARLSSVTSHIRERMAEIGRAPSTGTPADLLDRQALFDNLAQQLTAASAATSRLCFGRVDHADGRIQHIGRIGLRDDEGEPVLLDWRAPSAAGFYQATAVDPMGVRRRRRIMTRDRAVTHVEDEDLADPTAVVVDAASRSVEAPRDGRMGDIVATIAADQDRIIRSPLAQVTVVQGGPGTGKTVVALHRAAWLLYTHRDRLAKDGVLVIGPSTAFLRYIDQVLPSLGETDVVLLTPGQLYPPVSTHLVDAPAASAVKGDLAMVKVVAQAVRQRARIPRSDVTISLTDGSTITVTSAELSDAQRSVPRQATFHAGREPFLRRVLDALSRDRARRQGHDPGDPDVRQAMLEDIVDDPAVRRELNVMWLPTTPERVIDRLLSDPVTLASAADGILSADQQRTILRAPGSPWTVDDVPLLDEAAERLGPFVRPGRVAESGEPDYAELSAVDPFASSRPSTTVAERALADRDWVYGHVIVDEAQELSRMAWHALARRCTRRSMTIVGDLQQTAHPAGARDWDEALSWAGPRVDVHTLTITYRITRPTVETATRLLVEAGGEPPRLHPIREGEPTENLVIRESDLAAGVKARASAGGRAAVIVPDALATRLSALLAEGDPDFGIGDDAIDAPIAILSARETKGLEFDDVFIVEPGLIAAQGVRGADIYVACTRATRRLHLVALEP